MFPLSDLSSLVLCSKSNISLRYKIKVTIHPLFFPRHILARISIWSKISTFWLCFPVFILANWPIMVREKVGYRERSKRWKYEYILSVFNLKQHCTVPSVNHIKVLPEWFESTQSYLLSHLKRKMNSRIVKQSNNTGAFILYS